MEGCNCDTINNHREENCGRHKFLSLGVPDTEKLVHRKLLRRLRDLDSHDLTSSYFDKRLQK